MNAIKQTTRAALLALLAGLAGCATSADGNAPPAYAAYAGEPIGQFTAFRIDNFEVLGDDTLALWTRHDEAYLVRVWSNCQDLKLVRQISMSTDGPVFSRGDSVRVRGSNCPIQEIRKIDIVRYKKDRAAAAAAAREHARERAKEDAVQPTPPAAAH